MGKPGSDLERQCNLITQACQVVDYKQHTTKCFERMFQKTVITNFIHKLKNYVDMIQFGLLILFNILNGHLSLVGSPREPHPLYILCTY